MSARTEQEVAIVDALAAVLRNKGVDDARVGLETPLASLELDSLDLAELLVILEEAWHCELELDATDGATFVADLATTIRPVGQETPGA